MLGWIPIFGPTQLKQARSRSRHSQCAHRPFGEKSRTHGKVTNHASKTTACILSSSRAHGINYFFIAKLKNPTLGISKKRGSGISPHARHTAYRDDAFWSGSGYDAIWCVLVGWIPFFGPTQKQARSRSRHSVLRSARIDHAEKSPARMERSLTMRAKKLHAS